MMENPLDYEKEIKVMATIAEATKDLTPNEMQRVRKWFNEFSVSRTRKFLMQETTNAQ